MHWARLQTLLSHLPRLQTTWKEKEAGELARLLGKRRAPQQASCVGAFAAIKGAQTQASHFLLQPRGEADGVVGSTLPQSQPPRPCDPATAWLETSPCQRSGGNGPSRHPGPHPTWPASSPGDPPCRPVPVLTTCTHSHSPEPRTSTREKLPQAWVASETR